MWLWVIEAFHASQPASQELLTPRVYYYRPFGCILNLQKKLARQLPHGQYASEWYQPGRACSWVMAPAALLAVIGHLVVQA